MLGVDAISSWTWRQCPHALDGYGLNERMKTMYTCVTCVRQFLSRSADIIHRRNFRL